MRFARRANIVPFQIKLDAGSWTPIFAGDSAVQPKISDMVTEYMPMGDTWQPLGPVATQGLQVVNPDWTALYVAGTTPSHYRLGSVIEFPELLTYLGAPSYTFFEFALGCSQPNISRDSDWSITFDLSELYSSATLVPIQGQTSNYGVSFLGYFTGLLLSTVKKLKLTVTVDSFFNGPDSGGQNTATLRANLTTGVNAIEDVKMQRGLGTEPSGGVYRFKLKSTEPDWEMVPLSGGPT